MEEYELLEEEYEASLRLPFPLFMINSLTRRLSQDDEYEEEEDEDEGYDERDGEGEGTSGSSYDSEAETEGYGNEGEDRDSEEPSDSDDFQEEPYDGEYDEEYDDEEDQEVLYARYRDAATRAIAQRGPTLDQEAALRNMDAFVLLFGQFIRGGPGRNINTIGPFIADEDFDGSYEGLLRLSERIGEVKRRCLPLEKIAVQASCIWSAVKEQHNNDEADGEYAQRCSVCLEGYAEGAKLMILACSHRFHWKCAERWLKDRSTCPICRVDLLED